MNCNKNYFYGLFVQCYKCTILKTFTHKFTKKSESTSTSFPFFQCSVIKIETVKINFDITVF